MINVHHLFCFLWILFQALAISRTVSPHWRSHLQQGHNKVVAVLLENDSRGRVRLPALHIAAKKDDIKAATLLLQNEHNVDSTSKVGSRRPTVLSKVNTLNQKWLLPVKRWKIPLSFDNYTISSVLPINVFCKDTYKLGYIEKSTCSWRYKNRRTAGSQSVQLWLFT